MTNNSDTESDDDDLYEKPVFDLQNKDKIEYKKFLDL